LHEAWSRGFGCVRWSKCRARDGLQQAWSLQDDDARPLIVAESIVLGEKRTVRSMRTVRDFFGKVYDFATLYCSETVLQKETHSKLSSQVRLVVWESVEASRKANTLVSRETLQLDVEHTLTLSPLAVERAMWPAQNERTDATVERYDEHERPKRTEKDDSDRLRHVHELDPPWKFLE
jgi:hypothetical protein